jgi:preprotein translocase subunit SecD
MENFRLRLILAAIGIGIVFAWVMPNFINVENSWWPTKKKLNYGLDIQGGLHLVMGVDVYGVVSESTNRLATQLKTDMTADSIAVSEIKATKADQGELTIVAGDEASKAKISKFIEEKYSTMLQVISSSGNEFVVRYYDAYLMDYKKRVIGQAIETIRNRIDEFGVAEPSISQQGEDRILVQLPGMADAEKAKQLINTTAKLDFMPLSEDPIIQQLPQLIEEAEKAGNYNLGTLKYSDYVTRVNQDLKAKLPANTVVYFEKSENAQNLETGKVPFLVKTDSGLSGSDLDDSFVSFDQYGSPIVSLRFNSVGAVKFKDLTTQYVGKSMAIVLDRVIKSAPRINEPIAGGSAQITLGGGRDRNKMMDEAKMISTSLRAGALPAALEQLEERRVGPSLGADSVKKAQMASLIGALAIILFILIRYKAMGLVADISLGVNVLAVLALLSSLGATLTLPGIAGIALTVGFAVDANVLINERIREELAKGSSFMMALEEGYNRAWSAILDANVTTAGTAAVLLYFGTGPVKGFAVTLLVGIATTLFANVFISKVLADIIVHKFGIKKLSV